MTDETLDWTITVDRVDGDSVRFTVTEDYKLLVKQLGREVVIQGNAAGLETLARHLLTLAQPGVPSGIHLHLEDGLGLPEGSASLVLEREDDDDEYPDWRPPR